MIWHASCFSERKTHSVVVRIRIRRVSMRKSWKAAAAAAVLVLGSAVPVIAQIDTGMDFTTTFPFYAQNAKMPAGSYQITQSNMDINELILQSTDGKYSVFVDFIPTRSGQPH